MASVEIRPCTEESIRRLELLAGATADFAHHRERWAWQRQGAAIYLLAWQDDRVVGRATLLKQSKYETVRASFPSTWEINALEAHPQGHGIGTRLITTAEQHAARNHAPAVGLAVAPGNASARRLYQRLGYAEAPLDHVIDAWEERDDAGHVVQTHTDECLYMVKRLSS